jgi:hypothetical protein
MATVATTPLYPIPARPALVVFSFSTGASNYIRAWCTVAPEGSELANRIAANKLNRALVYQDEGGDKHPWRFAFDRGGKYTFLVQEYEKGNHWGGGYEGDPRGAPTETKVGSEDTLTLYVAQRLTQELGAGPDRATLALFIHNDTIVQTSIATHGEATPTIVDPTSDRARVASYGTAITAAVLTLVGQTSSTAVGTPGSVVDNMIGDFVAHAADVAFHENADDQSDLDEDYSGSDSLAGVAKALNKLRTRLSQHMQNSKENAPANPEYALPGGFDIHVGPTGNRMDLQNVLLPVTADEKRPATIHAGIGDFWRAYEAHRVADMHDASDTTNTLAALVRINLIHKEFMASLAALSPTAQPGQSAGAARLIGTSGFVEA